MTKAKQFPNPARRQRRALALILIIFIAAAVAVAAILTGLARGSDSFYADIPQDLVSEAGALVLGQTDAADPPVVVRVFLDFSDIRSARLYQTLKTLIDNEVRDGKVVLVENLVPRLVEYSPDPDGRMAAEATYCAFRQGAMWPMHDVLFSKWDRQFENYGRVDAPSPSYADMDEIELAARQVGIDAEQLAVCIREGQQRDTLQASYAAALDLEVPTTPAIYINEVLLTGTDGSILSEPSYEMLKAAVEAAASNNP
jgi:protein-disulfide isomerase